MSAFVLRVAVSDIHLNSKFKNYTPHEKSEIRNQKSVVSCAKRRAITAAAASLTIINVQATQLFAEIQATSTSVAAPAPGSAGTTTLGKRPITGATEVTSLAGVPCCLKNRAVEEDGVNTAQQPARAAALAQADSAATAAAVALHLRVSAQLSGGGWIACPQLNDGGAPLFLKSFNRSNAIMIKTSQVWPAAAGGTIAPGLDGTGRQVLMWDGGAGGIPFLNHPEFLLSGTSRITVGDGSSLVDFHASAVAGSLGAAGLITPDTPTREARGMAFNGNIFAHDVTFDLIEIAGQTLAQLKDRRVSNHSYGSDHGWTYAVSDITGVVDAYLSWEGDLALSQAESNYYGLYTAASRAVDEQAVSKPYFQTVRAAGNQRLEGPDTGLSALIIGGYPGFFMATFRNGAFGWTNWGTSASPVFLPQVVGGFGPAVSVADVALPNDGGTSGYDTLSGTGVAKNALVVGGVDANRSLADNSAIYTAHGPTDDGRMKPDVVAKAVNIVTTDDTGLYATVSGSSFAAPAVAGSANLVSFRHEDLWGNKEPMRSSTLRALITHTADDVTVVNANPALAIQAGPDYKTGWGTMDTAEAVTIVGSNHAALYNGVRMRPNIKEVFLPDGGEIDFTVKATGGVPVKVTAAWTDPAAPAQASTLLDPAASSLINDLDLTVTKTLTGGGTQLCKPWRLDPAIPDQIASRTYADSNMNSRDNLEVVETPTNGNALQLHRIRIKQKTGTVIRQVDPATGNLVTGGQWVSIVLSGVNTTNINFTITGQTFNFSGGNVTATLSWNCVVGQVYRIQRSTNLTTWTDNSGDIIPQKENIQATSLPAPASPSGFYRIAAVAPNPFNL